ncbi:MAG: hypothetical protein ACSHWU_03015 [Marinicella sp.]
MAQIDNPDLLLTCNIDRQNLLKLLLKITRVEFTYIEDLEGLLELEQPIGPWVHCIHSLNSDFPVHISIYGVDFPPEKTTMLAAELSAPIISSYDVNLKEHQWQLFKPNGSVDIVTLFESTDSEGFKFK